MIRLGSKSGFYSVDRVIDIRDERGNPFYYFENKDGKQVHFNLPAGIYRSQNLLIPAPFRVWSHETPPTPNRSIPVPKRVKAVVRRNPHKCSIDLNNGKVILDSAFYRKISQCKPVLVFVLLHERGHYYYGGFNPNTQPDLYQWAEEACDIYAAAEMYKRGFNPSQIAASSKYTLSKFSQGRIDKVSHFCKNSH